MEWLDKYAHGGSLAPLIYVFVFPLCSGDNSAMTCPALFEDYVQMSHRTSGSMQPEAESIGQFEECFPENSLH